MPKSILLARQSIPLVRLEVVLACSQANYNPGQNSLRQMIFTSTYAFPIIKILPVTAKCPLPLCNFGRLKKHTCELIYDISIGCQHCNWGWGLSTQNLLQKAECLMSFVRDCRSSKKHNLKSSTLPCTFTIEGTSPCCQPTVLQLFQQRTSSEQLQVVKGQHRI